MKVKYVLLDMSPFRTSAGWNAIKILDFSKVKFTINWLMEWSREGEWNFIIRETSKDYVSNLVGMKMELIFSHVEI